MRLSIIIFAIISIFVSLTRGLNWDTKFHFIDNFFPIAVIILLPLSLLWVVVDAFRTKSKNHINNAVSLIIGIVLIVMVIYFFGPLLHFL